MIELEFFKALYPDLQGTIDVRGIRESGVTTRNVSSLELLDTFAETLERTNYNAYFGVAERIGDGRDKASLLRASAFWVDVDYKHEGAREHLADALDAVPRPSIQVHSGGGVHLYWLLDEPFDLTTPEAIGEFESVLKGLCEKLGGDRQATDASRILRIPGTTNRKYDNPRPCKVLKIEGWKYPIDVLLDFALIEPVPAIREQRKGRTHTPGRREAIRARVVVLRRSGLKRSELDAALRAYVDEVICTDAECCGHEDLTNTDQITQWAFANVPNETPDEIPFDEPERGTVAWVRWCLRKALDRGQGHEEVDITVDHGPQAPRWPSSLGEFDVMTGGGFYGQVIILGNGGVGKSMLAVASGLEAAASGWRVIYLTAELDKPDLQMRITRYCENMGENALAHCAPNFRVIDLDNSITLPKIVDICCENVENDHQPVMVMIDSVNSISEYMAAESDSGGFDSLRRVSHWLTQARKKTCGQLGFLVLSETNAKGEVKGRKGYFQADVVMSLDHGDEENSVEIVCRKGRSGGHGFKQMYLRNWQRQRFDP